MPGLVALECSRLAIALSALVSLLLPSTALATASYSATSELVVTVLTVQGDVDIEVAFAPQVQDFDEVTNGDANASADFELTPVAPVLDLGVGESIVLNSSVSGSAVDGSAFSQVFVDVWIDVGFRTAGIVTLGYEYSLGVAASAEGPTDWASGFATAYFSEWGSPRDPLDFADGSSGSPLVTSLAGPDVPSPVAGSGSLTIDSNDADWRYRASTWATGDAFAVPEPEPAVLVALGLSMLAGARRGHRVS